MDYLLYLIAGGFIVLIMLGIRDENNNIIALNKKCANEYGNKKLIYVNEFGETIYQINNIVDAFPDDRARETKLLGGASVAIKPQMVWSLAFNKKAIDEQRCIPNFSDLITTNPNWACFVEHK